MEVGGGGGGLRGVGRGEKMAEGGVGVGGGGRVGEGEGEVAVVEEVGCCKQR